MEMKYGKYKGKTIEDIFEKEEGGLSYLNWLKPTLNVNDPKFGKINKALSEEIDRVINTRLPAMGSYGQGPVPVPSKPVHKPEMLDKIIEIVKTGSVPDKHYQALMNMQAALLKIQESQNKIINLLLPHENEYETLHD